jgi:hypothetical protein
MFDRSVIKRTGQWWKAMVAFVTVSAGTVAMFSGLLLMGRHRALVGLVLLGILVTFSGFIFAVTTIRCPYCGVRWVWRAIAGEGQWLKLLLGQSECPACSRPGGVRAA